MRRRSLSFVSMSGEKKARRTTMPSSHRRSVSSLGTKPGAILARDPNFDLESATPVECWKHVTDSVLPLFNGEGLQDQIEVLNLLVSKILESKSHADVTNDLKTLLSVGMLPIREKLYPVSDEKLLSRLVEVWTFFFGTVLPYLQGAFEPLHMERIDLSSQLEYGDSASSSFVRDLILIGFRKEIMAGLLDRVKAMVDVFSNEPRPDRRSADIVLKLIQLLSMISLPIRDEEQRKMDAITTVLKSAFKRWNSMLQSQTQEN